LPHDGWFRSQQITSAGGPLRKQRSSSGHVPRRLSSSPSFALMMAYVICHNERFLIDPMNPVWQHYRAIGWWLAPHGVVGACALLLTPLQFSERLRHRSARLPPCGGAHVRRWRARPLRSVPTSNTSRNHWGRPRSFTVATVVDAVLLLTTTGNGLAFSLKPMIPQHRQWMIRSYAVALTFFESRFIPGVTGLDQPLNLEAAESPVDMPGCRSWSAIWRTSGTRGTIGLAACMGGQAGGLTP
jgi:hypothetical protein